MYKLLIVEDEPLVRRGLKLLVPYEELQISEIIEAGDGEEGLRLFLSSQPDLVLLDINMPRMNGLDFARQVKEWKPDVKIAVLTGYDYYDYAVTALKLGIDDYVLKPVSRVDVYEVIQKLVHKLKQEEKKTQLFGILEAQKERNEESDDAGMKAEITRILNRNLGNPDLSLALLSEQVGFSTGHMSGLFKRWFGIPFQDYVVMIRLERAKLLMLSTGKKMYEIAAEVGFENPNYFSSAFKKKFGCSPLQYRERRQEG